MSGLIITRNLLLARPALLALVPAVRVISGVVPQGTQLPIISLTDISSTDRDTLTRAAVIKVTDRVQVTVMGATYPQVKAVIAEVRKACRNMTGTVGNFAGVTYRLDGKGPDFNEPNAGFCMQTQDTLITFNEAA